MVDLWHIDTARSILAASHGEDHYSDAVLRKAVKLVNSGKVKRRPYPRNYVVIGSRPYKVHVIDRPAVDGELPWVVCGCPNGSVYASTPKCYHSAAVLLAEAGDVDSLPVVDS